MRGGHLVPLHYGSAAGELAICMRSVGLVDREDLRVLMVSASPQKLDRLTADLLDATLDLGETEAIGEGHWGRIGAGQVVVAISASSVSSLCEALLRVPGAEEVTIDATELQAIGVVGPATTGLLTDLGIYGALAGVNGRGRIAHTAAAGGALWMLLDQASALALVEPAEALAAWSSLSEAGRRFGVGCVGAEAAERFEAVRRRVGDPAWH